MGDSSRACELCWASVSHDLMPLHQQWHDQLASSEARAPRRVGGEVRDLMRVVSAVRAVPQRDAAPDFFMSLREQLLAHAFQQALEAEENPPPEAVPDNVVHIPRPRSAGGPTAPAQPSRASAAQAKAPRVRRVRAAVAAIALVGAAFCVVDLTVHMAENGLRDGVDHPSSLVPHPHLPSNS